ncbi:hypothetical protein GGI03_007081 [Coemansia sp. RSA 2337]|nr:hypothetical protein GGI16_004751 [Coemansia sp. S142-1]KAJ2449516.1 hypothetical protein GGI03_007081 [Coemansia sp. RSA 2337]
MVNGIYYEIETYKCELAPDERLFRDSREKLKYLKSTQRRLEVMLKQLDHYQSNPLGGAMCKDIETRLYQLTLIASRSHRELIEMVVSFECRLESSEATTPDPQSQRQADWEEVVNMSNKPLEELLGNRPARSNSSSETLFKSIYTAPTPGTTASDGGKSRRSHKTFPTQTTPPIEEIFNLRESLRLIEQSPLFTTPPDFKPVPVPDMSVAYGLRSPKSLP